MTGLFLFFLFLFLFLFFVFVSFFVSFSTLLARGLLEVRSPLQPHSMCTRTVYSNRDTESRHL